MAFLLEKDLDTGYSADYWKVSRIIIDRGNCSKPCIIVLDIYKDLQARLDGAHAVSSVSVILSKQDMLDILEAENILNALYAKIKLLPDFSSAEDV